MLIIIIIIAVISIGPYLTDNGEHITLYNINNNVFIKTSKIINYTVMIFFTRTHAHTHAKEERESNNINNNKQWMRFTYSNSQS